MGRLPETRATAGRVIDVICSGLLDKRDLPLSDPMRFFSIASGLTVLRVVSGWR
jgi:hypothetical protein